MEWSDRVEERHDFSPRELDPSRSEALAPGAERPIADDPRVRALAAQLALPHTDDHDLFECMARVTRARAFAAAPWLQRVWGDDLFFTHLMQLVEPADWLDALDPFTDDDGASRTCCDRFYFRDPDALRERMASWWTRGPLYVDHPRRPAIVRPSGEPAREVAVPDDDARRVASVIAAFRTKQIKYDACFDVVAPWAARSSALPADVAGAWIAALIGAESPVAASDDLDRVLASVEERWGTFLAPLVQRVFGDDRFVERVARRFYAHHWFASVAPMRFEAPEAAEATITAWWKRFGARHRAAMVEALPVDALLEDAFREMRASIGAASTLSHPALVYLRDDPATVRAILKKLADDHASSTAIEVPWFVHRFGLDVDGLFELVVNRCDATAWHLLVEVLPEALRIRSPRVVKHLAPLVRRKGLRPMIEEYLLHEGADAIDGLLDMAALKGSANTFAMEWLERIASDDRGRSTIASLVGAKSAAVQKRVAPLIG